MVHGIARRRTRWIAVAGVVLGLLGSGLATRAADAKPRVDARGYALVDEPGQPLRVPRRLLDTALRCPSHLDEVTRDVVLMIPGTTVDPYDAFSWNYEKAMQAEHVPYCSVTLPNHTDDDLHVAAEYVVDAIRTIHAESGRKVVLFGWSQGASTLPRWALRWWPDVRPMVSSLVGLAPLNNVGSVVGNAPCVIGMCIPAAWQQGVGSQFMSALNSGRATFPGIAYTAIYSRNDDIVTPDGDGRLSMLPPGRNVTNVAIQDVCATDYSDHLLIVASPAAYAVALDAIQHPGHPADLSRVHPAQPCLPGMMPHVEPVDLLTHEAAMIANVGPHLLSGMVPAEPPLACYVHATCRPR
jgi:hypothetical protein